MLSVVFLKSSTAVRVYVLLYKANRCEIYSKKCIQNKNDHFRLVAHSKRNGQNPFFNGIVKRFPLVRQKPR